MIAFNLVGNTSAVCRLSIWFTYEKFKQMSMKDNAGNTLLLTCSIVILLRLPHPLPKTAVVDRYLFYYVNGEVKFVR